MGTKTVTSARRHVTGPVISLDVTLISSTLVRHFFTPSSPVTSTFVASTPQGPTLAHFTAQRKRFLGDELGWGFKWQNSSTKEAQVELRSGGVGGRGPGHAMRLILLRKNLLVAR